MTPNLPSLILITNLKGERGKPLLDSQNNGQGGHYVAHSSIEFVSAELKHSLEVG